MIGETLSHFKITAKLGEGGMGEVYRAEDTKLDREVALKTVPPSLLTGKDTLARFKREARAAASLNHPNIVAVYDAGVTDKARWAEACAEMEEASAIPWVILSAGVDDATFEAQTLAACQAGASGVLVGRSVWKEGAQMEAPERDTWLAEVGAARMQRLVDIVEAEAVPWRERSPLSKEPEPTEGWAAGYPGNPG